MNGVEGAMCLTYPIAHARDTDDSGSLKNDKCFYQKENPVHTSSSESMTFVIYAKS